jgi:hypothetical protein
VPVVVVVSVLVPKVAARLVTVPDTVVVSVEVP